MLKPVSKVKVQMAIVVDTADGKYLISDILEDEHQPESDRAGILDRLDAGCGSRCCR